MVTNTSISDLAIPPGELLKETIEETNMSPAELASELREPRQAINAIIKGEKSITPAMAISLESVLKVPAHIWTGLETEYQAIKAKQEKQKQSRTYSHKL